MALRLQQLQVHGFKSFATPTTFQFDHGLTAIVGPNGSGKSNVAEALRWVLGEQGMSNLRGRRTEDVIFSGSSRRGPLGVAEVTLTLDNADGDLPLAFSEVTVGRRAFRGGENQYLINGARVRLRDVQQLVSPLGQAYTIIGQGLVDAALSARPEERRGLFEHAAGIAGLRLRATEAERSLTETGANAQRLRDIVAELEPRVRSLERSARLAREYQTTRDQLHDLLRRQFRHLWSTSNATLQSAVAARNAAAQSLAQHGETQEATARELANARSARRDLASSDEAARAAVATSERDLLAATHATEVTMSERRAASERQADLLRQIARATQDEQDLLAELQQVDATLATLAERHLAAETHQRSAAQAASTFVAGQRDQRAAVARIEARVTDLLRRRATLQGHLDALDQRLTRDAEAQAASATRTAQADERFRQTQAEQATADARAATTQAELQAAEQAALAALEAARLAQQDVRHLQEEHSSAQRHAADMQARMDLLDRLHAEGEGLHAGVRAVMRASQRGELDASSLLGTVTDAVISPPELEAAVEVALGGHLQDIIVRRWADADAAIRLLRANRAGRATFQPLDTVRANRRPPLDVHDPGLIGIAADLVTTATDVGDIVELLLGRTLIVRDLDAAQRVQRSARGWTIVTLDGDITRPGGSVTGGSRGREAGVLARERERRALPARVTTAQAAAADLQARVDAAFSAAHTADSARRAADDTHSTARRTAREAQEAAGQARARVQDAARAQQETQQQVARLDSERTTLLTQRTEQLAQLAQIDADLPHAQAELNALHATTSDSTSDAPLSTNPAQQLRDADAEVARVRAEVQQLRGRRERIVTRHERAASLAAELSREQTQLERRLDNLDAALRERKAATFGARERLASARQLVAPLASAVAEADRAISVAEAALDASTVALRAQEREHDRIALALARAQDERVFLRERIHADLDGIEPDALLASDDADEPQEPPQEAEITRVRERLRRMSVIGDDAVEQFTAESERLERYRTQLTDIDDATTGLRRVLADLHGQMEARFNATFADVAAAFEYTFTRLFGGGNAHLRLETGEDQSRSVEIVAQPPGKRLQHLGALSGGERALTAVSLLIAILRVNPSPFCVLDEVDAALDEANVLRFRDELRDLAATTQFIVVTHNRGTIEGADTLYGVTMGGDGVSRTVSLRLEEAIALSDDGGAL